MKNLNPELSATVQVERWLATDSQVKRVPDWALYSVRLSSLGQFTSSGVGDLLINLLSRTITTLDLIVSSHTTLAKTFMDILIVLSLGN